MKKKNELQIIFAPGIGAQERVEIDISAQVITSGTEKMGKAWLSVKKREAPIKGVIQPSVVQPGGEFAPFLPFAAWMQETPFDLISILIDYNSLHDLLTSVLRQQGILRISKDGKSVVFKFYIGGSDPDRHSIRLTLPWEKAKSYLEETTE